MSECINWPKDLSDSGEDGIWVYAIVLELPTSMTSSDPAVATPSVGNTIELTDPDVVLAEIAVCPPGMRVTNTATKHSPYQGRPTHHIRSRPLATVLLGSIRYAPIHEEYGYWWCDWNSLTPFGQDLVTRLCQLYDRPVWLVTYLET